MNIRKAVLPDPGLEKIYRAFGCPMQPGGMKKCSFESFTSENANFVLPFEKSMAYIKLIL